MQVSVESGEGLEKRLLVDLPAERLNDAVGNKLKELAKHVRMDGFRPGKVPMRVVKQRYGQQALHEAYGDLIQATLYEAAAEHKLMPAGEPNVEMRDAVHPGGFSYTAVFEIMPEVDPADMSGVSIKRPVAEVTDADVDEMIEKLRKQRVTWNDVERAAQNGDTVHIDFKGMIDGEVFQGGAAEDVPLELGSGNMIDGFEAGLLGALPGDERTLELKFPDDYRAEHLAGKDATFEIKVKRVAEPQLPAIDAEFVKAFGVEDGSEAGLRAEVAKNMANELKQKLRTTTKELVMDALIAANPLTVPKAMVAQEAERVKQQTMQDMQQYGQSSSMDLPASIFEPQAQRRVHLGLVVGEVIRKHELQASDEKLRATIEELAQSYEDPQSVVEYYMNDQAQRNSLENLVLENEVVDWVLSQAQVEDDSRSFADMMGDKR